MENGVSERMYVSTKEESKGILITRWPFTWKEISEMVANNNFGLGRSEETAKLYRQHINDVNISWDSIDSFCKYEFLKFPFSVNNDGKKYVTATAVCEGPGIKLNRNNYPYSVENGVKHLIVWSVKRLEIKKYKAIVQEEYPVDSYDIIVFENPLGLKSVKSVYHVQVFVHDKTTN